MFYSILHITAFFPGNTVTNIQSKGDNKGQDEQETWMLN